MSQENREEHGKQSPLAFYLIVGPQAGGRSVLARYLLGRSMEQGDNFRYVDLTQERPTLNVIGRIAPDELERIFFDDFVYSQIIEMKNSGSSTIVECDASAQIFSQFFHNEDICDDLKEHNISLVVLFISWGGDRSRYLASKLELLVPMAPVPTRLIQVIPEWAYPRDRPIEACVYRELVDLVPSSVVAVPTCNPIQKLDGLAGAYQDAVKRVPGAHPLTLWERAVVAAWLQRLDSEFDGVVPFHP